MAVINFDSNQQPQFDPAWADELKQAFFDLVCLMARLRSSRGCPWDRKQTAQSLARYLMEETHEVLETIEQQNTDRLTDELGDLLFQILFQAQILAERDEGDILGVIRGIHDKMIRRHPHVFETDTNLSPKQVKDNWERIKRAERQGQTSIFDGFTTTLPALLEAFKIGQLAASVGFDWPDARGVMDKVEEELDEVKAARGMPARLEEELGDLIFAVSNLARHAGLEPESVLRKANRKFIGRFQSMEQQAAEANQNLRELSLDAMETLWQNAKLTCQNGRPGVKRDSPPLPGPQDSGKEPH